jgi:PAS domain S-box-containing protein
MNGQYPYMPILWRLSSLIAITILPAVVVLIVENLDPWTTVHIAAALALGGLLGLQTAWMSRRRFVHEPVQRLIALVNVLRQGKYVPGAAWAARSGEFGSLARALAEMAEPLAAREIALREALEHKTEILESIEDAFYALDREWRFTYVNRRALELWGKPAEQLIGQRFLDAFPQAAGSEPYDALARAMTQRCSQFAEIVSPILNRWLAVSVYPSAHGGLSVYFREIAGRKVYEALLSAVVDHMPVGVMVAEAPSGRLIMSNREAERIWRRPVLFREPTERYRAHKGFHPDGRPYDEHEWPLMRAVSAGQTVLDEEIAFERGDGTRGLMSVNAAPVRDQSGQIIAGVVAFSDVTDRRRTEEALRESRASLSLALAAAQAGTWDWSIPSDTVKWSPETYELFGLDPANGTPGLGDWERRVHPDDLERAKRDVRGAIEGRVPEFHSEYRIVHPARGVRWLVSLGRVERAADGTALRMAGINLDITERKRAEERLKLLAAEVDHRAKNMLALVQVIVRQTSAATVKEYTKAVLGRVSGLARAHTLLSQSRWEGAELRRLVEEEAAPFRRTERERIQISGPPVALSPRAAQVFAMVLHELATNAVKHGALSLPQGRVSVDWRWREAGWLSVRWAEACGPLVQVPTRRGLGSNVIERSIAQQLDGEVRFDWRPEGLVCEVGVPSAHLRAPELRKDG